MTIDVSDDLLGDADVRTAAVATPKAIATPTEDTLARRFADFDTLGAAPQRLQVDIAAGGAMTRNGQLQAAMVAAQPVFGAVQGIVLVFFAVMIIGAWRRFRPVNFA